MIPYLDASEDSVVASTTTSLISFLSAFVACFHAGLRALQCPHLRMFEDVWHHTHGTRVGKAHTVTAAYHGA